MDKNTERFPLNKEKLTRSKSVHADDREDQGDVQIRDPGSEMLHEKANA